MTCHLGKKTRSEKIYLENMSKVIFRVGLSFKVVDAKWKNIKEAFKDFDPRFVSKFPERSIEKMLEDDRLIRNFSKLDSVRKNALIIEKIKKDHGSFDNYIAKQSLQNEKDFIKTISKEFNLLGPTTAVYFLRAVGFELVETMKLQNFKTRGKNG